MNYAEYETVFGLLRVEYAENAVTALYFVNKSNGNSMETELTRRVFYEIKEYLDAKRQIFTFPVRLCGSEFQLAVWSALQTVPYGETRTYGEIAGAIKKPKAARAVGAACNKNPIIIAVPCHRIIGADGSLTGYAAGLDLKKRLLELEAKASVSKK